MRRVKFLIKQIRAESDNEDATRCSDDTIIEFLNRAQDRLVSAIAKVDETFLSKEGFIDLVNGQSAYQLPSDMLIKNRLISVERRSSSTIGIEDTYWPIRQITPNEQSGLIGYFVQQDGIKITPPPSGSVSSGLRLNYVRCPYRLEKRRGIITAVTPTSITIAEPELGAGLPSEICDDQISVNDSLNAFVVGDIVVTGYNSGTGVITTTTDVTATASLNDYVLFGRSSRTVSELPTQCERFLIEASKLMIFHKDSSDDRVFESNILVDILGDIEELFSSNNRDAEYIPVSNSEYLDY